MSNDTDNGIIQALTRIRDAAARDISTVSKTRAIALLYNSIAFPVILALFTANYTTYAAVLGFAYYVALGSIILVAAIILWIQLHAPDSAARLYFDHLLLEERNALVRSERDEFGRLAAVSQLTTSTALTWLVALPEHARARTNGFEALQEAMGEIVAALSGNKDALFGIEEGRELWNFAIYLWCENTRRLVPVYRDKSPRHPGEKWGRAFAMGQGHVGKAFSDRSAKITADSSQADVRNLMEAAPDLKRDYDDAVYVSYASIPIGDNENGGLPFGVLVATSDRAGRFDTVNSVPLRLCAQALATLIEVTDFKFDSSTMNAGVAEDISQRGKP